MKEFYATLAVLLLLFVAVGCTTTPPKAQVSVEVGCTMPDLLDLVNGMTCANFQFDTNQLVGIKFDSHRLTVGERTPKQLCDEIILMLKDQGFETQLVTNQLGVVRIIKPKK